MQGIWRILSIILQKIALHPKLTMSAALWQTIGTFVYYREFPYACTAKVASATQETSFLCPHFGPPTSRYGIEQSAEGQRDLMPFPAFDLLLLEQMFDILAVEPNA